MKVIAGWIVASLVWSSSTEHEQLHVRLQHFLAQLDTDTAARYTDEMKSISVQLRSCFSWVGLVDQLREDME